MKYIINESQFLKLIQEQEEPGYGKRCDIGGSAGVTSADKKQLKQDKIDDRINRKEDEKNAKIYEKQRQELKNQFLNPKLDAYGNKMDKNSLANFQKAYTKFLQENPDFTTQQTEFTPEQRFGFFNKIALRLNRNPSWGLHNKLKNQFNHTGPITEKQLFDYSQKMGNFNDFVDLTL